MYGSYGSYSSMCAVQMTAPMDISGASTFSTGGSHYQQTSSCAFPSWPRRSSLSDEAAGEYRATSYLSDEDLFPTGAIDDDARSVSSAGSGGSLLASPAAGPTDEELLEMQRERQAHQRELVRFLMNEKERLRRQRKQRRSSSSSSSSGSSSSSSKKGSKSKLSTVAEAGGE